MIYHRVNPILRFLLAYKILVFSLLFFALVFIILEMALPITVIYPTKNTQFLMTVITFKKFKTNKIIASHNKKMVSVTLQQHVI